MLAAFVVMTTCGYAFALDASDQSAECKEAKEYRFSFAKDEIRLPRLKRTYSYQLKNTNANATVSCQDNIMHVSGLREITVAITPEHIETHQELSEFPQFQLIVRNYEGNWYNATRDVVLKHSVDSASSEERREPARNDNKILIIRHQAQIYYVFRDRNSISDNPHVFVAVCRDQDVHTASGRNLGRKCTFQARYKSELNVVIHFYTSRMAPEKSYILYERIAKFLEVQGD